MVKYWFLIAQIYLPKDQNYLIQLSIYFALEFLDILYAVNSQYLIKSKMKPAFYLKFIFKIL